ncbi:MAG: hypothetical protein PHH77_13010, partial [Victivallaceae bacterium]|nr:hypothetical protein [Victivallaceae bacterium]
TLASLSANWLAATVDYRPSAFWFWNSPMSVDDLTQSIEEMAGVGIREFLIHPMAGLELEYLSDTYFERYRLALRLAQKHGLKVWAYDEYCWPSGNAGGKLLREHPEHRGWFLKFVRNEKGDITAAPEQFAGVLDNTVGAPWTKRETGYLDTLSESAVRCFIEMTHERIFRECKEFFGKVLVGFFTDEPVIMIGPNDNNNFSWNMSAMPWTPSLPEMFQERYGYAIEPRYAELAGNDCSSLVKRDYWALAKEMYVKAYHGQIGRWCRAHGVKYTGHAGENTPLMQVRFSGSIYQCLSRMDEPGIDFLNSSGEPEHRFQEQVLIPSVARHSGKKRVYCEAFCTSPYELRLGRMLRQIQMMGIHGIDDIALMGFHQSLDGIRKRAVWPPLFHTAPWWPFYPEFRDACARSIGLTALGKQYVRYAILYPQHQLEQTDLFFWPGAATGPDPVDKTLQIIGLAVYEAGETFEYVFPEILEKAQVKNKKIVFPHAEYEAVLVPDNLIYFEESIAELERIEAHGGRVLRDLPDNIAEEVKTEVPLWAAQVQIKGKLGDIRVVHFNYRDGELLVIRNVTDEPRLIQAASALKIAEWNPADGEIINADGRFEKLLEPHSTCYFTVSASLETASFSKPETIGIPVEAEWVIDCERPNLSRFDKLRFSGETASWRDAGPAVSSTCAGGCGRTAIPAEFRGTTRLKVQGEFNCKTLPDSLGVLFEQEHVESLAVNGIALELRKAAAMPVWDASCLCADIRHLIHKGGNLVSGILKFKEFETKLVSNAFYHTWPMPTVDLGLAGSFKLDRGFVVNDDHQPVTLPLNLSEKGWRQYSGILALSSTLTIDAALAETICGVRVDLLAEDAVELLLDGKSFGKQIVRPYYWRTGKIDAGQHTLQLRLAGTSANILDEPSPWGVNSVDWVGSS